VATNLGSIAGDMLSSRLRRLEHDRMHSFQVIRRAHDLPFTADFFVASQRKLTEPMNAPAVSEPGFDRRLALPVDFTVRVSFERTLH